ncbi:MAG TPA: DUF4070 domain-containing protein, partial [Stellaceae bacterium]|nr:DUF4070 domain-containing protein [Stellaceae bacterium]
ILDRIYDPGAYYARVEAMAGMLDRPVRDAGGTAAGARIGAVSLHDMVMLWRLARRIAVRQPRAFRHFCRALYRCARRNPRALDSVGMLAALFLHLGPFSRFVIAGLDRQIAAIDVDEWRPPVTLPAIVGSG